VKGPLATLSRPCGAGTLSRPRGTGIGVRGRRWRTPASRSSATVRGAAAAPLAIIHTESGARVGRAPPSDQGPRQGGRQTVADRDLSLLTDDEKRALMALLKRVIDVDRYPLSPRIGQLRGILAKLEPPKPAPPPPPPLAALRPPRATAKQRRARE
jgi:hypothetical protein